MSGCLGACYLNLVALTGRNNGRIALCLSFFLSNFEKTGFYIFFLSIAESEPRAGADLTWPEPFGIRSRPKIWRLRKTLFFYSDVNTFNLNLCFSRLFAV